ncbi:hypothetical protein AGMMS49992_29480 [Clostridia bacterium]|nr:hypothetical protein AGMMS49992_29480 [Clostridia bacterium]
MKTYADFNFKSAGYLKAVSDITDELHMKYTAQSFYEKAIINVLQQNRYDSNEVADDDQLKMAVSDVIKSKSSIGNGIEQTAISLMPSILDILMKKVSSVTDPFGFETKLELGKMIYK